MSDNNEMTVIGRDTKIKGEMSFDSGARILGTFEGKITSAGEIQIGNGARCNASIEAERVVVDGNINGDINASSVLTLNAEAHVVGDIIASKLVVIEGATFEGNCRVGPGIGSSSAAASSPRKAAVKSAVETPVVSRAASSTKSVTESKPVVTARPVVEAKAATEALLASEPATVETRNGSTDAIAAA